ncbi:SRPBCC family protein [Paenisporosarcina antarctica]|uniref:SRPBCC family protein n=1 Tax=Paenisporosarcina antarctica TaxID=417367 RepID=A0A4P7A318_9BACL|nr:SRPBCC family protein [Paenisporosarcina antarctica]QBP42869.1 SRPBCC family protein [Paenisporosarcina antarctica]
MKWEKERDLDAPINIVWALFEEEQAIRIMPKVVENKWIEKKSGILGSTYEQTYQEGKRQETYVVEILEFEDTVNRKHKHIKFQLANAFEMNLSFTLERVSDIQTKFIYSGSNIGINFIGRTMLKLGSRINGDQVIYDFLDRVEKEAILDYKSFSE